MEELKQMFLRRIFDGGFWKAMEAKEAEVLLWG
jgi:hypothetical protein